jgi:hypothetical protein
VNTQSWFWLLLGLVVVYALYKKAMNKHSINMIIKIWSEPGTPVNIANSAKPKLAKLKKELFRQTAFLCGLVYVLVVTNLVLNYLKGWYVLVISGLIFAYIYLRFETIPSEALLKSEGQNEPDDYGISLAKQHSKKLLSSRNVTLQAIAATLVVSGIWAYQVQKNQSEEKLAAMNEIANLVGQGWCANFWDINAVPTPDGSFDVSKTGGWPCITIGAASNVQFKDKGNLLEMCFDYELHRSVGPPSDEEYLTVYDYDRACSSDDIWEWSEGWDSDSIRRKISEEKRIPEELDKLETSMCRSYYFTLSSDERGTYCYGVF